MKVELNLTNDKRCNLPTNRIPNFKGKMRIKGLCWNQDLYENFYRKGYTELGNLLDGHDVIVRETIHKVARTKDKFKDTLFNITVSRVKENSWYDRLMDKFNLIPRYKLSEREFSQDQIPDYVTKDAFINLVAKIRGY